VVAGALVAVSAGAALAASPLSGLPPRAYVVGTYDGRSVSLYVNGVLVAHAAAPGPLDSNNQPFEIGAYAGGAIWSGTIGEVAVYDRALPASEIVAHYRLGIDLHPPRPGAYSKSVSRTPGLVSYWRLDDAGTRAVDAHGSNNGIYGLGVARGAPGLISGDPDQAAEFNGKEGAIVVRPSASLALRHAFTLEAWVTTQTIGNHLILGRVNAYFLKTDNLGRWGVGVFVHHSLYAAYSQFAAHAPTPAAGHPKAKGASDSSGFDPLWLVVIAVVIGAAVVARRWILKTGAAAG
jgi:hypothetical protein